MKQSMRLLTSSESNEWGTPRLYVDAARDVMGSIDLDPASTAQANAWIKATTYYTVEDDGLSKPFFGNVWLNPPYGRTHGKKGKPNQAAWSAKLIDQYRQGNVQQAVLLTKCVPGYIWWERLFAEFPVCFCRERIFFLNLDNGEIAGSGQAKAASSFWYFGDNVVRFANIFSGFGRVILP